MSGQAPRPIDDKRLIQLVREHEELYNADHDRYSDVIHKTRVWHIIGKELNIKSSACKIRWVSLRDQLRKVLKKRLETGCKKKWRHEDSMSFLIPYFKEKETRLGKGFAELVSEESNDEVVEQDPLGEIVPESDEEAENRNSPESKPPRWIVPPPNMVTAPASIKGRNSMEPETLLMEYIPEARRQEPEPGCAQAIDLFFSGIAATVKTFPREYQHMAKARIFSVVSDLEWAYLEEKKPSQSGTTSMRQEAQEEQDVKPSRVFLDPLGGK